MGKAYSDGLNMHVLLFSSMVTRLKRTPWRAGISGGRQLAAVGRHASPGGARSAGSVLGRGKAPQLGHPRSHRNPDCTNSTQPDRTWMLGSLSLAVSLNSASGDLASGWRSRFLGANMICWLRSAGEPGDVAMLAHTPG